MITGVCQNGDDEFKNTSNVPDHKSPQQLLKDGASSLSEIAQY